MSEAAVRIWHQSMTDLTELPEYCASLESAAQRILGGDAEVSVHGVRTGTYPEGVAPIVALQSPWLHHLLESQIVLSGLRAAESGVDAITIGCFFDPGLAALRDLLSIPVLSACETSIHAATQGGGTCALIALDASQATFLENLVRAEGTEERVVWVRALEPPVTEPQLDLPVADAALLDALTALVVQAARDGAMAIIPAEGTLNALLVRSGVTMLAGLPVIDATAALLLRARALVRDGSVDIEPRSTDDAARHHLEAVTASVFADAVEEHAR